MRRQARACTETHINVSVRFSFQGPSGRCLPFGGAKNLEEAALSVNRNSPFSIGSSRFFLASGGGTPTCFGVGGEAFECGSKFRPQRGSMMARSPQGFHARVGLALSRKERLSGRLADNPKPLPAPTGESCGQLATGQGQLQNPPREASCDSSVRGAWRAQGTVGLSQRHRDVKQNLPGRYERWFCGTSWAPSSRRSLRAYEASMSSSAYQMPAGSRTSVISAPDRRRQR